MKTRVITIAAVVLLCAGCQPNPRVTIAPEDRAAAAELFSRTYQEALRSGRASWASDDATRAVQTVYASAGAVEGGSP